MKSAIIFIFIVFSTACAMQTVESQKQTENPQSEIVNPQSKQAVLVELFTSEGCASCPPADKVLAFLEREQPAPQAEIITLAFHVDYWDYLGWKDAFSSPLYSQRQQLYGQRFKINSIYTPQMIVDGQTEFVGSNSGKAVGAVVESAKAKKAKIEMVLNENLLKIDISEISKTENATVFVAIAEDNLASNVKRGENSGLVLEHASVVRELKTIGSVNSSNSTFSSETKLEFQPDWKKENLKIVVFVQENESRKVLGAKKISLASQKN